jgi:hypothetical protein
LQTEIEDVTGCLDNADKMAKEGREGNVATLDEKIQDEIMAVT